MRFNPFKVFLEKKSYLNLVYLLLSFFLGILYFTSLITGFFLGFCLFIFWIGIPILLGTVFLWHGFSYIERTLARVLLNLKIKYVPTKIGKQKSIFKKLKLHLTQAHTWKSLVFLLLKFPLGIISFVITVAMLSVSLSFLLIPLLYYLNDIRFVKADFCIEGVFCYVNNYFSATLWGILGLILLMGSFHFVNLIAEIFGSFAKEMLEKKN